MSDNRKPFSTYEVIHSKPDIVDLFIERFSPILGEIEHTGELREEVIKWHNSVRDIYEVRYRRKYANK